MPPVITPHRGKKVEHSNESRKKATQAFTSEKECQRDI